MLTKTLIKEIIIERNPEALFLEKEFDEALMGSAIPCGQKHVAIYDSDKCISIIMKKLDINETDAFEQFLLKSEMSIPSDNKPILFSNFGNIKDPKLPSIGRDMIIKDIL